jgi:hypothetical protein
VFQQVRALVAVVFATLSVVACTSDEPSGTNLSPPGAESGDENVVAQKLTPAWSTKLRSMQVPAATRTGFAFYRFTPERAFQVVSLDAKSGDVRWSAPASPSAVVGGEGLELIVAPDRERVVWMKPSRKYTDGLVTLTASDEKTGKAAWTFGAGRLQVDSTPSVCRDGEALCVVGRRTPGSRTSLMVLDLEKGKLLQNRPLAAAQVFRQLSDGLRDDGKRFVAVNQAGKQVWSRTYRDVFGADVAPDFGWDIQLQQGRYVGSLGYRDVSGAKGSVDLRKTGDTAGFSARTGETLWVKHGATVQCGPLRFLIDHPMRCSYKGSIVTRNGDDDYKNLEVTVEGFNVVTGKATWTWKAGDVPALYDGGPGVTRVGTAQYAVKTAQGTTILDADEGPVGTAPAGGLDGWCDGTTTAEPRADRQIAAFGEQGYTTSGWYPCRTNGQELKQPPSTASFAVSVVAGIAVWTDQDGQVKASKVTTDA